MMDFASRRGMKPKTPPPDADPLVVVSRIADIICGGLERRWIYGSLSEHGMKTIEVHITQALIGFGYNLNIEMRARPNLMLRNHQREDEPHRSSWAGHFGTTISCPAWIEEIG